MRATAEAFGVSKSTVHKDLTERLDKASFLYIEVRKILNKNLMERAFRGGESTRRKHLMKNM